MIAALTHELLKRETFVEVGALAEAVKVRCARLRIPYDGGSVGAALTLVGRTRRLVTDRPPAATPRPGNYRVVTGSLTRHEAAQLLARLGAVPRSMR